MLSFIEILLIDLNLFDFNRHLKKNRIILNEKCKKMFSPFLKIRAVKKAIVLENPK